MKDYIEERAVEIAYYIIEHKATVRQTAKAFGVSKSTIHKDVTERLLKINPSLAAQARKVLDMNTAYPRGHGYQREVSASAWAGCSRTEYLRRSGRLRKSPSFFLPCYKRGRSNARKKFVRRRPIC